MLDSDGKVPEVDSDCKAHGVDSDVKALEEDGIFDIHLKHLDCDDSE